MLILWVKTSQISDVSYSYLTSLESKILHRSIESSSWIGILVVIFQNPTLNLFCGPTILAECACSFVSQVQFLKCLMAALMSLSNSFLFSLCVALPSAIQHVACFGVLTILIILWTHLTWFMPLLIHCTILWTQNPRFSRVSAEKRWNCWLLFICRDLRVFCLSAGVYIFPLNYISPLPIHILLDPDSDI